METIRKPFQGVINIVRFNRHFYIITALLVSIILSFIPLVDQTIQTYLVILSLCIAIPVIISLLASFYIYDFSGFYKLQWLNGSNDEIQIININAGFDETTVLFRKRFPNSKISVVDFYDPEKHTEISIKRARNAYPPIPGTIKKSTTALALQENTADKIFVIFAAHEIRNDQERLIFFEQLKNAIKPSGEIYVTEHLRDLPNFSVYTIGFFHFYSKNSWKKTFLNAGLKIQEEKKVTPFVSNFKLVKNGNSH